MAATWWTSPRCWLSKLSSIVDPHGILAHNLTGTSLCHWVGVSCSRRRQRVTDLFFSDTPLGGSLVPQLGKLSFLSSLSITDANLPNLAGRLRRLKYLNLAMNGLSSAIPAALGNLTRLEFLFLTYNQLTGRIPPDLLLHMRKLETFTLFNDTPSLRYIDLGTNSLSGPIPSNQSFSLPVLHTLYLSENKFSGQIPLQLASCRYLEILSLGDNFFVDVVPWWLARSTPVPRISFIGREGITLLVQSQFLLAISLVLLC